jgi:plastocyanin
MSILGRKIPLKVVAAVAVAMIVGAFIPLLSQTPSREVTLVVRGMTFYAADDPSVPNPTIEVRAGETVRLVLRNEDRGMTHDFAVPALAGVATKLVNFNETGTVTIDVPNEPGVYEYVCRPHRPLMRGTIRVLPAD